MELFSLEGKVAVIIGGSKGLGKGVATALALAGATVVLGSRNKIELNTAVEELKKITNTEVIGISVDITTIKAIEKFVESIILRLGKIDILVNSAGVNIRKNAMEFSEMDWDNVMDAQLKYVFFMNQIVAKTMIAKNITGKIINMASLTSVLGLKNMVAYGAAKAGIVQMTKSMANELAPYGINVNAIGPGYYETEMTKPLFSDKEMVEAMLEKIPLQRMGVPADLSGVAVLLASNAANYITGQVFYVDGGWLIE